MTRVIVYFRTCGSETWAPQILSLSFGPLQSLSGRRGELWRLRRAVDLFGVSKNGRCIDQKPLSVAECWSWSRKRLPTPFFCDNLRKSAVSISSPNLAPLAFLREESLLRYALCAMRFAVRWPVLTPCGGKSRIFG